MRMLFTSDIHASSSHLFSMLSIADHQNVDSIIIGRDLIFPLPAGGIRSNKDRWKSDEWRKIFKQNTGSYPVEALYHAKTVCAFSRLSLCCDWVESDFRRMPFQCQGTELEHGLFRKMLICWTRQVCWVPSVHCVFSHDYGQRHRPGGRWIRI